MRDDAGDVVPDQVRQYVAALIEAWQSGARRPDDIFSDARASWLSGRWPKAFERGHDAIGMELLFFLASARDMALGDGDIPALRTYLASTDLAKAQQRFFEHWETTGIETREAAGKLVDYYGPPPTDLVEDSEFAFPDPADRWLHRHVRIDPEGAWPELRGRLSAPPPRDETVLVDLVEDLVLNDPDGFIDRLEGLAEERPESHGPIAAALIVGRQSTPGLERFWALQERLGGWGESL